MPGSPATSPNLGLPRFDNATDPADFSGSINPIVDGVDGWLEAYGGALTTLPTTGLFQGREVYLQTAAMATKGLRWRFCCNLASASPLKWEFVGGAPWFELAPGAFSVPASGASLSNVGSPALTFTPGFAGEFQVDLTADFAPTTGAATQDATLIPMGTETYAQIEGIHIVWRGAAFDSRPARGLKICTTSSGSTIGLKGTAGASPVWTADNPRWSITPIRAG